MASRAFAAIAAALCAATLSSADFVVSPTPAHADLSITPFNISMDCVNGGTLPSLAGMVCVVTANVHYSAPFDLQALVSLTIDGYFVNGTSYRFADSSALASFSGVLDPSSVPSNSAFGSYTAVEWTVALPPSFETLQLLATVVVDWPNEVQESDESNNIARRMLQNNGLPYIVFVEQEFLGTFIFGVDMLQRIFVTLDQPLPSNAYLALQVDYNSYTNIDARTNVLTGVVRSGAESFYEYTLTFGMGSVRPLGRNWVSNPDNPNNSPFVGFKVQLVFDTLPGASASARSNLTGNTPLAAAMSPGFIAQSVEGFFQFTDYRGIVNDLIGLIYPIGDASQGSGDPSRASLVTANLVRKDFNPAQRSAYFAITGVIPAASFASIGSLIHDPSVATSTWGSTPAGVLSGAYGAALVMGDTYWTYSSSDQQFWIDRSLNSPNMTLMAAGVSFNIPVTVGLLFDDGDDGESSTTDSETENADTEARTWGTSSSSAATSSSSSEVYNIRHFDGSKQKNNVVGLRLSVSPPAVQVAMSSSTVSVNLADGVPVAASLQWSTPLAAYWGDLPNFIDVQYVPSSDALRSIGNSNLEGVQSTLELVPADSVPFLTSGNLLFIRKRTLTFMLNGPELAYTDDANRLERLSSGTYWDAKNVGGHVNFTLDVGAGASNFLSRIDYVLRWKPYNATSHGFSTPLSKSIQSTYVGYATAVAANAVDVASLTEPSLVAYVTGDSYLVPEGINWYVNSGLAQVQHVRSDSRLALAANLDFTNIAAVYETGGPGTSQAHPDVNYVHFDCGADCFAPHRSLRDLAVSFRAARRELFGTSYGTSTDDNVLALSWAESDDYQGDVVPHFWPSIAYAAPAVSLVAVEARFGWAGEYAFTDPSAITKTANFSLVRIFALDQHSDYEMIWTIADSVNEFNGFPTIASYYGLNSSDPDEPWPVGNRSVVVWLRDVDGNTEIGSHWVDQTIMWSHLQQTTGSGLPADDFTDSSWSTPRAVGGVSGGGSAKTIEALQVAVDATVTLMTRVDPVDRKAYLHAWRTSGAGTYAMQVVSSDSPVGQVTLLRDADGSTGFTVAYVFEGNVKYVRGTITDGATSAPVIAFTTGAVPVLSDAVNASYGGVSILAGCLTPYGQALAFLTRAGLVVSERLYDSAPGLVYSFQDTATVVNNVGPDGSPEVSIGALGPDPNDLQLARQKGLQVAYADTTAFAARNGRANNGVFHLDMGPKIVAVVHIEDFSSDLIRNYTVFSAFSSAQIVNVTFPGADTPGSTFRVLTEVTNFGAVRSMPMVLTVSHVTDAAVLGVTIVPPILAGRTIYVETLASVPSVPGFFVNVELKATPASSASDTYGYSNFVASPNNVFLDTVDLDSSLGLSFQIVNSGPLFGHVAVSSYSGSENPSDGEITYQVDSWSNTSVAVTGVELAGFFFADRKLTAQPIYVAWLEIGGLLQPSPSFQWENADHVTLLVASDSNPWDNVVFLDQVLVTRPAVTPDSVVAYPAYRSDGSVDFVNAVGTTNAGNVPWLVSFAVSDADNLADDFWQSSFYNSNPPGPGALSGCDGVGCKNSGFAETVYWCTGAAVSLGPVVVNPGETCFVYVVDFGAAQAQSSYALFYGFVLGAVPEGFYVNDVNEFTVPSLLIAPHEQPKPFHNSSVSSGYSTWDSGYPGQSTYSGGHYAMWRPYADSIGQPLLVLATGSPVTYEGDISNFTAFVVAEAGSSACSSMCSTGAGSETCDEYAQQCFSVDSSVQAKLVFSLWRPVPPTNATTIHYGDYHQVQTYQFTLSAGYTTIIPAGSDFNWHVLPGDVFGWYSDYDNAARVVFSNASATVQGPGGAATSTTYYQYSHLPGGRARGASSPYDFYLSESDLSYFGDARQYSIEVGVAPAQEFTGRINLAVDLDRNIILVSTQATAGSCPSVSCRLPGDCASRRELFSFTDDGAGPWDAGTTLDASCHFGSESSTSNVLVDPFAVVVDAWSDGNYLGLSTVGYGAPMYGNECQTVVLPLSDALRTWILDVNQSDFCYPPVNTTDPVTPTSDVTTVLKVGILPVSELYRVTSRGAGWPINAYAGASWNFTVAQVIGLNGNTWSLSQCPQQASATALIGRDTATPTLHSSKSNNIAVELTVQTTCSRAVAQTTAVGACNSPPYPVLNPSSATLPYSTEPEKFRVAFDSTGTFDENGDTLLISWHVVSKPAFSKIGDDNAFSPALQTVQPAGCVRQSFNASKVWFQPDVGGVYTIEFRASDGCTVSAVQSTVTVVCGVAPTALVSHVQAVFNHAQSAGGDPNTLYWQPDPLNPDYADDTTVELRAFNSEFFLNSAAASSQLEFFDNTARAVPFAYSFQYEWSITGTDNPAVSFGLAHEPWNVATSTGPDYKLACLGSAPLPSSVLNSSSPNPPQQSETTALMPADQRTHYVQSLWTSIKPGYESAPIGNKFGSGALDVSVRFGRFSAVGRVTRTLTSNSTSFVSFNQSAPILGFFIIENAGTSDATLHLPADIRCRGKIDVQLRVIDQCDPSQVAEFNTSVVTQCPPAPVAVAGCNLVSLWSEAVFPTIALQPGVQTIFAGPLPDGNTEDGSAFHARWLPYNDAAKAATVALYPNGILPATASFTPPEPGTYEFLLLVSDGCWRDYISNDTLTINAVCRPIDVVSKSVTTPAGLALSLAAAPASVNADVTVTLGATSDIAVGSFGPLSSVIEEDSGGLNPRLAGRYFTVSQQSFSYAWRVDAAPSGSFWSDLVGSTIDYTYVPTGNVPAPDNAGNWAPWFDVAGVYTLVALVSDGCSVAPAEATFTITVACNNIVAAASAKYNTALPGTTLESCEFDPLTKAFTAYWTGPVLPDDLGGGFTDGYHILLDSLGSSVAGLSVNGAVSAAVAAGYAYLVYNWTQVSGPAGPLTPSPYTVFGESSLSINQAVEPQVPGTYVFEFFLSDQCAIAASTVSITAKCNPLQFNMTLDRMVPQGPGAGEYVTAVPFGGSVYYVPENGTFPDLQVNARSVYTKQGPYSEFSPWDAALWLPYEFAVAENGTFGYPFPPEIDCAAAALGELTDPGFETGDPTICWTASGAPGAVSGDNVVKVTGRWSAQLTADASSSTAVTTLSQEWKVPAGADRSYISFHWRHDTTFSTNAPGSFTLVAQHVNSQGAADGPYTQVWPPAGAHFLVPANTACDGVSTFCSGVWYLATADISITPFYSDFEDVFSRYYFVLHNNHSGTPGDIQATTIHVDTVTLFLSGGTTPPPGVPWLYYQPVRFHSPGPKSIRVQTNDGCSTQSQSFSAVAVCRALVSETFWVFPQKAIGVSDVLGVTWSVDRSDGFDLNNHIGRWIAASSDSGNDGTGVLGFKSSSFAAYSDGSAGGYPPLSVFDPTKEWNTLSVGVSTVDASTHAQVEAPASPGVQRWQKLPPGGCNLMVSYGSPYNVSTASGVAGTSSFPTVKASGNAALPSPSRLTVGFGFRPYTSVPPVDSDDFTEFGYYPNYLAGFIHACPLKTSPNSTYITPTFAIVAVYPGSYVTLVSYEDVMQIDCKKLGVLLGNDVFAPVFAPAIAIADNVLNGTQQAGTAFKMTYFALPPLNYGLLVQGTNGDGQFELTTALYDPDVGHGYLRGSGGPTYLNMLLNDFGEPSEAVNCQPFGGADYLSWGVNTQLTALNLSSSVALNPNVAATVQYVMTISDGCTNSTSLVRLQTACTSWLSSNPSSNTATPSALSQYQHFGSDIAPVSFTWQITLPSDTGNAPQAVWSPTYTPQSSVDAHLLVVGAPAGVVQQGTYYNALAMQWVSSGNRYSNGQTNPPAWTASHNNLYFYPPSLYGANGSSGTYSLVVLGQDGCLATATTPVGVSVQCEVLAAAGSFVAGGTAPTPYVTHPSSVTSIVGLSATMVFQDADNLVDGFAGYNYEFGLDNPHGIFPSAILRVDLTASYPGSNPFDLAGGGSWVADVLYSVDSNHPFESAPGNAWSFVNPAVVGASVGTYYWEFVATYTGVWKVTLYFYDGTYDPSDPSSNHYCSSASVTFTITVSCNAQGYNALTGTSTAAAVTFNAKAGIAGGAGWRQVYDDTHFVNVTLGVVFDYHDKTQSENGSWPIIVAIPPGGAGVVTNAISGDDIFSSVLAFKYAAAVITLAHSPGFSQPTDYWTVGSSNSINYGTVAQEATGYPVAATYSGGLAANEPPQDYFAFHLPLGSGGPGTTSAVNLFYAVFDGCMPTTDPTGFTFYAMCNRTIDNSGVLSGEQVYWTGTAFQQHTFDASGIRFLDESGFVLPTRPDATNTFWNLSQTAPGSKAWTNVSGVGATISSGGPDDIGHTMDAPGTYEVFFHTTDFCQIQTTPYVVVAVCSPITAAATASRAPTTIDLISPTPQSTTAQNPIVLSLESFDGVDVVLDARTSSVAYYPGIEDGHTLYYNWSVGLQPSVPSLVNYWEDDFFAGLSVSLLPSQMMSPVVVARLRVHGTYRFDVNVTDHCLSSLASVYVSVVCDSPPIPSGQLNVRNAVSYYDASLPNYNPQADPSDAVWRTLTLNANFTRSDGCLIEGDTDVHNLVRVAWTQAAEPLAPQVYPGCAQRECSVNPNDGDSIHESNAWGYFQAIGDPNVAKAASTVNNVVGFTAHALDFCLSAVQKPVTVTGQCLPASLVADSAVVGSGANAGEWDPVSHWDNLRVGFQVVYSSIHDPWEDALPNAVSPVLAALNRSMFSVRWELVSAPSGSLLSALLSAPSGCTSTYVTDSSPLPNGVSFFQDCSAVSSDPPTASVVRPLLTFLTAADPVHSQYSEFPGGRAFSAKLVADVSGSYTVRAHWTDGCAYATLDFVVNADCPALSPALTASIPVAGVPTPTSILTIPVGNASSWTCVTLDASGTVYTQPDGSTAADDAALNARWFLTAAPSNSQFNPYRGLSDATTDVGDFPVSAASGTSSYRISADYAVVSTLSLAISAASTTYDPFQLELFGANGMSVCFVPDVEGSYTAELFVQDFCPSDTAVDGVVATRNATATTTFSVQCVGNFSYDISLATRTVVANTTNWMPIQLLPAGGSFNVPTASRFVRTFWNLTSAPSGHSWIPLDISSTGMQTLDAQYATLHVSNLESVQYAAFVPTAAGVYTFTLSVWDPRCPTSITNRTIAITVLCGPGDSHGSGLSVSASVAALNGPAVGSASNVFEQDDVMSWKLSVSSISQPVRYSWRAYSVVPGQGAVNGFFTSSAAAAASSSSTPALTQGGIAGVVIGVIVGAVLLLLLVVLIVRAAGSKGGRGAVAADTGAAGGDAGAAASGAGDAGAGAADAGAADAGASAV